MELVGAPELCLVMRIDQPDGAVIAYLEDVAPDGRLTYLSEGELRLLHRKTSGEPCDPAPGTKRTFKRADGAPVLPGETMRVELPLLETAALIRAGHSLRLSLAGADKLNFADVSLGRDAHWSVDVGANGSELIVPMRDWNVP
jgi:predicted acyl esterase